MAANSTLDEAWLESRGIRATANRLLVIRTLRNANRPLSLADIEEKMPTMDRSSIFRALSILLAHDIVHGFEDGRGVLNYELCREGNKCDHSDFHAHFYCEKCRKSFCLSQIDIPGLRIPDGFSMNSVSFVIKGLCPDCLRADKYSSR